MSNRNYWLCIFSPETWQEFLAAGADTAGFQENRASLAKRLEPGDYLLCYVTKSSCWIAILEVESKCFVDKTPIWKYSSFPYRVKVKTIYQLTLNTAIPVLSMKDELTVFQNLANSKIWSGSFRVSPFPWKTVDGDTVFTAIEEASQQSVE